GDRLLEPAVLAEGRGEMAAILFPAEFFPLHIKDRVARDGRNAVINLLPVDRDMRVADLLELLAREFVVRAFRFLQAQHVGRELQKETLDEGKAQATGIYVPGGDCKAHGMKGIRGHFTAPSARN